MAKNKEKAFAKQFKPGTFPDQHWDESTRINDHQEAAPAKARKRQGLALGTQSQANPGMVGDSDYKRGKRK